MVLLARSTAQLEETRGLLRQRGVPAGRVSVLPADLADEEDRGRAVAAALAAGRVDILVNNAATVEPLGPTAGVKAGDLRLAFEVNHPERIGSGLHERFNRNYADGALITSEHSAAALLALLAGGDTGAIWDVGTAPAGA